MGRKAQWVGEKLHDLLELSIDELCDKYPQEDRNKLRALQSYHRRRLMEREPIPNQEILEQHGLEAPEGASISYHIGFIKNAEGEIEYTKPLPSVHVKEGSRTVDEAFPQVEASTIRPTKRRRKEQLGETTIGYGDGQVDFRLVRDPRTLETRVLPLHNVEMHRIILQMNAYYQPNRTINGGDFADFAGSSRFPADSDHFNGSMTLAMQWIHDFYSQIVTDNPNALYGGDAEHYEVASNHADRPRKKVLKEMPEFYNFYRPGEEYPAWTYYSMARLGELGIKHTSGYPHGEIITGEEGYPQVLWKHGNFTGKNAVYREAETNPSISVVRWHNHGLRMIERTTREGAQLFYIILGSSCLNGSTVPGFNSSVDDFNEPVNYHNQEHTNNFLIHRDYGKGRYENTIVDVVNGKAYYDGMEWDGTQPYEWEYKYGYIQESSQE